MWRAPIVSWWGLTLNCPPDWSRRDIFNAVLRSSSIPLLALAAAFATTFCGNISLCGVVAQGVVIRLAAKIPIWHLVVADVSILAITIGAAATFIERDAGQL